MYSKFCLEVIFGVTFRELTVAQSKLMAPLLSSSDGIYCCLNDYGSKIVYTFGRFLSLRKKIEANDCFRHGCQVFYVFACSYDMAFRSLNF